MIDIEIGHEDTLERKCVQYRRDTRTAELMAWHETFYFDFWLRCYDFWLETSSLHHRPFSDFFNDNHQLNLVSRLHLLITAHGSKNSLSAGLLFSGTFATNEEHPDFHLIADTHVLRPGNHLSLISLRRRLYLSTAFVFRGENPSFIFSLFSAALPTRAVCRKGATWHHRL